MSATIEPPTEITGQLISTGQSPILYRVSDAKIDEIRAEFTGIKILDSKTTTDALKRSRFAEPTHRCREVP